MDKLLLAWTDRIARIPLVVRTIAIGAALAVVAGLDLVTGPDLTLSFTYALCVLAAAWALSTRGGLIVAVVAALIGFLVDAVAERDEHWSILIANHVLRLVSFSLFAVLAGAVRQGLGDLLASSRRDPMTGALSKQGLLDELARARLVAERARRPIGVVYFDLDGLKLVNDRDGHAAGDALIRRFVDRVSRHLRATDPFGRLGGDEFALVIERAEPAVIDLMIGRILGDPGLPEVSCGVQVFIGEYPTPDAMLAGADRRMYEDKVLRRGTGRPSF